MKCEKGRVIGIITRRKGQETFKGCVQPQQDGNPCLNIQISKAINFQKQLSWLILMENSPFQHIQQGYYFIINHFPPSTHLLSSAFPAPLLQHFSFYTNSQQVLNQMKSQSTEVNQPYQENSELMRTESLELSSKSNGYKKHVAKNQEYNPKEKSQKEKRKKVYEKDKQRNVLPNALSKLFFFLKSPGKSENLLKQIIENNQSLGRYVNSSKYYSYQSLMKSKMERFMTQESLKYLFQLNDPQFYLFTLEEQLAIIKINGIMVRNFIKNNMYLQLFLNSSRSPKSKISWYIKKYRLIESQALIYLQKARENIDFRIIQGNLNE